MALTIGPLYTQYNHGQMRAEIEILDRDLEWNDNSPNFNRLVPVERNLKYRFYEPIVLLITLNRLWANRQKSRAPELSMDPFQTPEHDFQCFVNKLSQLCDTNWGGKTVTAFVILQSPDHVEYRFASNLRTEPQLISVQSFVKDLLQTLHKVDDFEPAQLLSHILCKALIFARPRLGIYIKSLKVNAALCVRKCEEEDTAESKSLLQELYKLQNLLSFPHDKTVGNDSFSKNCEALINAIDFIYESEINEIIRERSKEGKINESECWCELRHHATRLLSYLHATKCLISTRKRRPELFENFEVCYVKSSVPETCPLKSKRVKKGLTMRDIIGRMTSDQTALEKYRDYAQQLERFGIDQSIQDEAWDKNLRPYVHAEILLLASLLNGGGADASRFYGSYKYIGCSKPACRLCSYYFNFHPSGVRVRPTHRNLYENWRMPDVRVYEGAAAATNRRDLMNKILGQVRKDAFRLLIDKVPEKKGHDSNTEPTYRIDGMSTRGIVEGDSLTDLFQNLDIARSEDDSLSISSTHASSGGTYSYKSDDEEAYYDEESEGGAKL